MYILESGKEHTYRTLKKKKTLAHIFKNACISSPVVKDSICSIEVFIEDNTSKCPLNYESQFSVN